jgi:hypothetical protein
VVLLSRSRSSFQRPNRHGTRFRKHFIRIAPKARCRTMINCLTTYLLGRHVTDRLLPGSVSTRQWECPVVSGRLRLARRRDKIQNLDAAVSCNKRFSGLRSRWTIPFHVRRRTGAICWLVDCLPLGQRQRQPFLAKRLAFNNSETTCGELSSVPTS